jgi:hypothetical protein
VELAITLVTGRFAFSAVRLTSVLTLLIGGWLIVITVVAGLEGGLLGWPDCWAAALIRADCRREVLQEGLETGACTGDGGAVEEEALAKLSDEGGLSKTGDGTITELSSM